MQDGACVRPGECKVSTGGTCSFFGCNSWRNADCVDHTCVCPIGSCAVDGKCVETPAPRAAPSHGIICDQEYSGPVRNQGSCGSCWAFSTAQQLRYMAFKKYQTDPGTMSAQFLNDCMPEVAHHSCSDGVKGCCGGLPIRAEQWLEKAGGLPTQAAYGPYRSGQDPDQPFECRSSVARKVVPRGNINMYSTEKDIANALCRKGPVSIAIAAGNGLMHYNGGIMNVQGSPAGQINHAVLYTGVSRTFDDGQPVHVILNSWGPSWGVSGTTLEKGSVNGHILFKFGENVANIRALATGPDDVEML